MTNAVFDYVPFLKKAYVDPIRTVTVIDDEYPTLERLLNKQNDRYGKPFTDDNEQRLNEVISYCKLPENNWMLDVYDGDEDIIGSNKVANRLHHSDLLILDYHLDGDDNGVCERALNLLRHLADNKHFNLVAIHTKGYQNEKDGVAAVFKDVIIALQQLPHLANIPEKKLQEIEEAIDEWEYEIDSIRNKLIEAVSELQLLQLLKEYNLSQITNLEVRWTEYLDEFETLWSTKPEEIELKKKLLFQWLVLKKFEHVKDLFNHEDYSHFDWEIDAESNWIKTDDLFVTVLGKSDVKIHQIPDHVLKAISKWTPHPHKLILAKLRYEIEKYGISAAQNILNKQYLQAAWLAELVKIEDDSVLQTTTWSTIYKLWEQLAYEIKQNVSDFSLELMTSLKKAEANDSIMSKFIDPLILEDRKSQIYHANCFSCSKEIDAYHLKIGHVVKYKKLYWLCLTPACDLVPGQKNKDKDFVPATFVQLHLATSAARLTLEGIAKEHELEMSSFVTDAKIDEQIIKRSSENNLIFIKIDSGKVECFSFTSAIDGKSAPKAQEFYLENQGQFDSGTHTVRVWDKPEKPIVKTDMPAPERKEVIRIIKRSEATVVAELRYEYALNLLGRLGISKTRVGLDFMNK